MLTEMAIEFSQYLTKESINNVVQAENLYVFTECNFYFNTKINTNF